MSSSKQANSGNSILPKHKQYYRELKLLMLLLLLKYSKNMVKLISLRIELQNIVHSNTALHYTHTGSLVGPLLSATNDNDHISQVQILQTRQTKMWIVVCWRWCWCGEGNTSHSHSNIQNVLEPVFYNNQRARTTSNYLNRCLGFRFKKQIAITFFFIHFPPACLLHPCDHHHHHHHHHSIRLLLPALYVCAYVCEEFVCARFTLLTYI